MGYPTKKQSFSKTAFWSGTPNFFGPSYFEAALVTSKKPGTDSFIDGNIDGARNNREPLGQRKEMKIHQGAITHEICCLAAQ